VAVPAPGADDGPVPSDPVTATGLGPVEVACDESGSEGDKLVGGTTDVFAHASVLVRADLAAAWLDEVRLRARSPAEEVKASVVLREQNRSLLRDLLGADGPYAAADGGAFVHLTDKRLHLLVRLLTLLGGSDPENAAVVHRDGPALAGQAWDGLLRTFNDLMRARTIEDARRQAAAYRGRARLLARALGGTALGAVVARTADAVPATDAALLHLLDRKRPEVVLDPLLPALAAAVAHWGADGRPVRVVHDEHRALREAGLERLESLCGPPGALDGIRFVDSRDDARVQLADFLAGTARRLASGALAGRPDPELVELLRPYVGVGAVWREPEAWTGSGLDAIGR
jgi:Protein of unknown function (DUF3800)